MYPTAPSAPGAPPNPVSLGRETDPAKLVASFERIKTRRQNMEREWKLNLAFYKGNQYAYYNRRSDRIESLPTEDGDKPRWRVRIVANQIQPGVQGYVSMLTKTKPVIYATPGSGSNNDLRSAQVADKLYEYWWQEFALDDKLKEALVWSTIAANGWWKISWDPHAGTSMTFVIDPQGQIITDDALAASFKEELAKMGIDPAMFTKTVYLGDIRVEALPPFCVWVDPIAKTFEEARWAVCEHTLTPEEIKQRWGVDITPNASPADYDSALPFSNAAEKIDNTVRKVYIGYFLPGPGIPKGRYVVWTCGPDKILADGPWQFPTQMLPLVRFPGVRYPGRVEDEALVTAARPLQKDLNKGLSQLVEHRNLVIRPQMMAEAGSIRQRPSNEPGAIFEYNSPTGTPPKWRDMPSVPAYVADLVDKTQGRIDRLFMQALVTRGEVPPNVEAAVAIDLLQETAVDQVAPVVQSIEIALARAGRLMIALAREYYIEQRSIKIIGDGGRSKVAKFYNADIDSGVDFHAEAGSGLPRSRAMKQARIKELVGMGAIPIHQALKYLDVADMHGVKAKITAAEDRADRENDKLLRGDILNPEAIQNALMYIQQGMNPETGQPLQDDQEAQMVLEHAAVAPSSSDNHAIHLDVLTSLFDSVEFEGWPMDARRRALMHFDLHQQAASAPPMPQPEAPRVSLAIHGTMGPTGTSKLLQNAGVPVTPEEAMEMPLESVVIDTIDKPDAEAAGNDPLTPEEQTYFEQSLKSAESSKAHADSIGAHAKAATAIEKLRQTVANPPEKKGG